MKHLTIQFDVDGVLADFVLAFTRLCHTLDPSVRVRSTRENSEWDMPDIPAHITNTALAITESEYNWWDTYIEPMVEPYVFGRIDCLSAVNQVVFCTGRYPGRPHVQIQTHNWLRKQGIERPNVINSKFKGEVARILGSNYSIDDKPENAACVHWMADKCKSFWIQYNNNDKAVILPKRVVVVKSVEEFLDAIQV